MANITQPAQGTGTIRGLVAAVTPKGRTETLFILYTGLTHQSRGGT